MTETPFHNKEIEKSLEDSTKDWLQGDNRFLRFHANNTQENIYKATNDLRQKLRDYLDRKSVPCAKRAVDPN